MGNGLQTFQQNKCMDRKFRHAFLPSEVQSPLVFPFEKVQVTYIAPCVMTDVDILQDWWADKRKQQREKKTHKLYQQVDGPFMMEKLRHHNSDQRMTPTYPNPSNLLTFLEPSYNTLIINN